MAAALPLVAAVTNTASDAVEPRVLCKSAVVLAAFAYELLQAVPVEEVAEPCMQQAPVLARVLVQVGERVPAFGTPLEAPVPALDVTVADSILALQQHMAVEPESGPVQEHQRKPAFLR